MTGDDDEGYAFSSAAMRTKKGRHKFKIRPPIVDDDGDDDDDANRSSAIAPPPPPPTTSSSMGSSTKQPQIGRMVPSKAYTISQSPSSNKSPSSVQQYISKFNQSSSKTPTPSSTSTTTETSRKQQTGKSIMSKAASPPPQSSSSSPPPLMVASDTSSSSHTSDDVETKLIATLISRPAPPTSRLVPSKTVAAASGGVKGNGAKNPWRQESEQHTEIRNNHSTKKRPGSLSNMSTHSRSSRASSVESMSSDDDDFDDDDDDDDDDVRRYSKYRKYLNPGRADADGVDAEVTSPTRTGTTVTATVTSTSTTASVEKAWRKHSDRKTKLGAAPVLDYSYRYTEAAAGMAAASPPDEKQRQSQNANRSSGEKKETKKKSSSSSSSPALQSDKLSAEDLSTIGMMLLGGDDDGDTTDDDDTTLGDGTTIHTQDSSHTGGGREGGGIGESGTRGGGTSVDGSTTSHHQFVDGTSSDGDNEDEDVMSKRNTTAPTSQHSFEEDATEDPINNSAKLAPIPRRNNTKASSIANENEISYERDTDSYGSSEREDMGDVSDDGESVEEEVVEEVIKETFEEEVVEEATEEVSLRGDVSPYYVEDMEDDDDGDCGDDMRYRGNEIPMDNDSRRSSNSSDGDSRSTNRTSLGARSDGEMIEEWVVDDEEEDYHQHHNRSLEADREILGAGVLLTAVDRDEDDDDTEFEEEVTEFSEDNTDEDPERHNIQGQSLAVAPGSEEHVSVQHKANHVEKEEPSETDGDDSAALWEKSVMDEQNDLNESYQSISRRKAASELDSVPSHSSKRSDASSKQGGGSLSIGDNGGNGLSGSKKLDDSLSLGRSWEGNDGNASYPYPDARNKNGTDEMEASIIVQELGPSKTQRESHADPSNADDQDSSLSDLAKPFGRKGPSNGDLDESDEFSLKASQELNKIDVLSMLDRPEYDHRASKMQLSSSDMMTSMNKGLADLDTSFSANNDIESAIEAPKDTRKKESTEESGPKKAPVMSGPRKPTVSAGAWRHFVRGSAFLFLLAAIAVPLYFLVWYDNGNDSSTNNPQAVDPIFPPSPTIGTQNPSAPESISPPPQSPSLPPDLPVTEYPTPRPTSSTPQPPSVLPPARPPLSSPSPTGSTGTGGGPEGLRDNLISAWPSLADDLAGFSTPQFFAFDWLLNNTDLSEFSDERILQRFALATFFFSTDGANWTRNDRWLSDEHECLWYTSSVTLPCDDNLQYKSLDLSFNGLAGTIPSELALLSNSLSGIDLSSNSDPSLTGSIPSEVGFLTFLETINLSGNQLNDALPSEIGNWRNVQNIDFSSNQFLGSLPSSLENWTELSLLNMENNELEGTLPSTIGLWTGLIGLYLGGNSFVGPIPPEIGRIVLLENLELQKNGFTLLPTEIGNLQLLRDFSAGQNEFAGPLVTEIGNLVNLLSLDLSGNSFTGSLPSVLGNLITLRDQLDLSNNSFSGSLPSGLGRLIFLRNLRLQSNELSGTVPKAFAKLDRLNSLRLEDNNLSGAVPEVVCSVYNKTLPIFVTDCLMPEEIECDCCMFCCKDGGGCECQFSDTDFEFLCADFAESPGLEKRIVANQG